MDPCLRLAFPSHHLLWSTSWQLTTQGMITGIRGMFPLLPDVLWSLQLPQAAVMCWQIALGPGDLSVVYGSGSGVV